MNYGATTSQLPAVDIPFLPVGAPMVATQSAQFPDGNIDTGGLYDPMALATSGEQDTYAALSFPPPGSGGYDFEQCLHEGQMNFPYYENPRLGSAGSMGYNNLAPVDASIGTHLPVQLCRVHGADDGITRHTTADGGVPACRVWTARPITQYPHTAGTVAAFGLAYAGTDHRATASRDSRQAAKDVTRRDGG